MSLTASERATINFYNWEYRYRGYYHFDTPIDIEIPYTPFIHSTYSDTPIEDDGRVPSLFKQVTKLLSPPKEKDAPKEEISEVQPRFLAFEDKPHLVGTSIVFPKETEIQPNRNIEFLNMLSFSEHVISFEIVGTSKSITIQIVCSEQDKTRIKSHFKAYFPLAILQDIEIDDFGFSIENTIAIADFGLNDEYMRPIATTDNFSIDPLTSIIATMEMLQHNDVAVFQVLFKGITSPLARDISYSVSDGAGGSFFVDAPDMVGCAKDKIANPLFSVVMRIAAQGKDDYQSKYLARELARSVTTVSTSEHNKLIPLSNEGYDYDFHSYNLHHRLSNRLGFVLNSKELNTFLHYPNKTIISQKLGLEAGKTKQVPKTITNQKYLLGINKHYGVETKVMLNDEMRLRHTHIIGSTGVGKSTLITNMMIEDMECGNGCALFDPHGDIVEDILLRIPEHRKHDVILIDPSDENYAIGFNLLQATTDAEKIVLSSDLVSAFKRYATAWGDNMTAVLSNAINTFLESNRNSTLLELKRFLLEESFRKEFLTTVNDPSILYYWNNEYAMVRKNISPLLTRIDTFLRPKIIRYMLSQNQGVNFKQCIDEKKIVLIKLSQGLIGESNSFLLGSLFLSKINQAAQGRQLLQKKQRHPYYIYLDEFQNFITPSITKILSGARKYGLGLILAHQELAQIDNTKVLNSVISNPYIRVCFRLGDMDAKKLESGFSFFDQSDLQNLNTGQTIIRIGTSQDDFNLTTFKLKKINSCSSNIKDFIIKNTRKRFSISKSELDKQLIALLQSHETKQSPKEKLKEQSIQQKNSNKPTVTSTNKNLKLVKDYALEEHKEDYIKRTEEQNTTRKHRSLQYFVKTIGLQQGYKVDLEAPTKSGGRVDVSFTLKRLRIAIEISVTNRVEYEIQNIQKCIDDNYTWIIMLSDNSKHLEKIKIQTQKNISKKHHSKIHFTNSKTFTEIINNLSPKPSSSESRIKGYRVKTNFTKKDENTSIEKFILGSIRKKQ